MCSTTTTTTTTAAFGGDTSITTIHPDIIESHILNRLDGPTLASTTCASLQLNSLSTQDHLWMRICNATWPSTTHPTVRRAISAFPSAHRSFYSDSFPASRCHTLSPHSNTTGRDGPAVTSELISAVDIYCGEKLIYSKVVSTETHSGWSLSSPFRIELLEPKETVPTPLKYDGEDGACMSLAEERLRISWILIDPSGKRAVNVASVKAVEARRHWLTEDIQLRYATVVGGVAQCAVVVSCGGREGGELQVREVSMQVEDMEGKIMTGMSSLGIVGAAMKGRRRRSDGDLDKEIYGEFLRMKIKCRERKQRRERRLDMVCIAAGVSLFFAIWMFFLHR